MYSEFNAHLLYLQYRLPQQKSLFNVTWEITSVQNNARVGVTSVLAPISRFDEICVK